MHRADFILVGPIEPLLPRALRVPLPAALAGAVCVLCAPLVAAIVMAIRPVPAGLLPTTLSSANGSSDVVPIAVVSEPVGAEIRVDDREVGHTPATGNVARDAVLVLRQVGFLDTFISARTPSAKKVELWRAQPDIQRVRPPMPGTSIASADFLPDGRVALSIELPP